MGDMQGDAVFSKEQKKKKKKKKKQKIYRLHALYARTTYYTSVRQPVTNQGSAMAPEPQLAHLNEGTLIRRSSLESFRLCDAFVTERLVSIILSRMRRTLGPSLSLDIHPCALKLCRNRPLASAPRYG